MDRRTRLTIGAVGAAAVIAVGAGVGLAGSGDERPLQGSTLEKASSAALEHVGEGTVTETESGEGGAAYEVEVRREDGSQVEVRLDGNFEVIGTEGDDDGREGTGEDDD
jgi:hypothetical protein